VLRHPNYAMNESQQEAPFDAETTKIAFISSIASFNGDSTTQFIYQMATASPLRK